MKDNENKLRGGYYTPKNIANFITDWAIREADDNILEPSCGDGIFIETAINKLNKLGSKNVNNQVTGVELYPEEANKARKYGGNIYSDDFFNAIERGHIKLNYYDACLGNPPFIRYQNFDIESRDLAFDLIEKYGFHPNKLMNIWMPFLIMSTISLKDDGRLGMVIPAELLQVDYAKELRSFLKTIFDKLIIITFKKLVFDGIQQEVVILLGEKKSRNKGIKFLEFKDIKDLEENFASKVNEYTFKELKDDDDKWTKYYLSQPELDLLEKMKYQKDIVQASELYDVNVGIVTGNNKYFVINKETVDKYDLKLETKKIITRSDQLSGLALNEKNYIKLIENNKKVFLFDPQKINGRYSDKALEYIKYGEEKDYDKSYKCRIRKEWYKVPLSWKPEAFMLRQVHLYPKLVLNNADIYITDTIHKVRFKTDIPAELIVGGFINSYTFAVSETIGRSYGGGVLTFEPSEARSLGIPIKNISNIDIKKIDQLLIDGKIEEALDMNDQILLKDGLGLSDLEINSLRNIWYKLRNRRLNRK